MEFQEEKANFVFYDGSKGKVRKTKLKSGDLVRYDEKMERMVFLRPSKRQKTERELFLNHYGGDGLLIRGRSYLFVELWLISACTGLSFREIKPDVFEFFRK